MNSPAATPRQASGATPAERPRRQVALANRLAAVLDDPDPDDVGPDPARLLLAVSPRDFSPTGDRPIRIL